MRHLLIAAVALTSACAPVRDEVTDSQPFPNDYTSALFAVETPQFGTQWEMGKLLLADAELDCDDLDERGELAPWTLEDGTPYAQVFIRHGVALDGWLRDYPAYELWLRENPYQEGSDDVTFFWGQMGQGGEGGELPPEDDRGVNRLLGQGTSSLDDLVSVGLSTDGQLAGAIEYGLDGDALSFAATKCPSVPSTWF